MMKFLLLFLAVSAVKADDRVNEFFRKVFDNIRLVMPTGIPGLGVPPMDPLAIPNLATSIEEKDMAVNFKASKYRISRLSSFKLNRIHANLEDLTLSMDIHIPQVDEDGDYELKGTVHNTNVERRGRVFVKKELVGYKVTASLEKTNDILQIKAAQRFDESVGATEVMLDSGDQSYFAPLMGGMIASRLINQIKPRVNQVIRKRVVDLINRELAKTPVSEIVKGASLSLPYNVQYSPSANNFIDKLLENVRKIAPQNNLDPLPLPNFQKGFSKKILFIRVHGEAKLYDGHLRGLSTIHRTGDANVQAGTQGIDISASIGLQRLVATYRGSAKFMNLGPSIRATVHVDGVRVYLKASQNLTPGAGPTLKEFRITSVGKLSVKIDGLGPLGWILGFLTTGVSNIIKGVIVNKIEGPIRQLISNEISKVKIPISF